MSLLSEYIEFKNGKKRPAKQGVYPVYGGNGILSFAEQYNLDIGVVIGRVGAYCGSVFLSEGKCWVSDNAIGGKNRPNADLDYIYYLLKGLRLNTRQIGTSQPLLTQEILNNIQVQIPRLEIQKRIVNIIKPLDNKIKVNEQINHNLEQQVNAIFKSWFIDFEPFRGEIPTSWKKHILDECCSLIAKGITPKYSDESTQRVINQKCIRDHCIDLSLTRTHLPRIINDKWVKFGDILINSTGTGTLGRVAQILFHPENLTVDSHVTIIRPLSAELIYFLGLWCLSQEGTFEKMATGSTGQTDLPRERLKTMSLLIPTAEVLKKFAQIVEPLFSLIIANQKGNERLVEVRNALLPKLMNGEVDVAHTTI